VEKGFEGVRRAVLREFSKDGKCWTEAPRNGHLGYLYERFRDIKTGVYISVDLEPEELLPVQEMIVTILKRVDDLQKTLAENALKKRK
jgi:hypothetical protein